MSAVLILHRAGPGVTVQDLGREGFLAQGLSRGGAADPLALAEAAALLGQPPGMGALEIAGVPLEAEATAPVTIALTGAPMAAKGEDGTLAWNATHRLSPGQRLRLTSTGEGNFSYLSISGGVDTPPRVGGRGAHLAAGLGGPVAPGSRLPLGASAVAAEPGFGLPPDDRFGGGTIRILAGPQTPLFPAETLERFLTRPFVRSVRGNRQGVELGFEGAGFRPEAGLHILSEVIVPGDIQVTGDGTPYVLGPECQTIGGYPRIGTVVPQDLARVMQAPPGATLRFVLISLEEALAGHLSPEAQVRALRPRVRPLVRDPRQIPDLLSYTLVSGVTAGHDPSDEEPLP